MIALKQSPDAPAASQFDRCLRDQDMGERDTPALHPPPRAGRPALSRRNPLLAQRRPAEPMPRETCNGIFGRLSGTPRPVWVLVGHARL